MPESLQREIENKVTKYDNYLKQHALIWHDKTHYDYQSEIIRGILRAIIMSEHGETVELPIEIARQAGKTTSIVDAVEFILCFSKKLFGRPLAIGIFAPQREQATTDFDRLKVQHIDLAPLGFTTKVKVKDEQTKFPEKWNSKTIRLFNNDGEYFGEVYIFPISKNSNPESKSLDLVIIEEAQHVDDPKMMKSVFPMVASTNGPKVFIGTAGERLCYFKRLLDNSPLAIIIPIERVFADRRKVYEETGDPIHLRYEQFVQNEIKAKGKEDDYIRSQYFLEWIIGTGQFTTREKLDTLIAKGRGIITTTDRPVYVGIDTAKHPDRTVVTILADKEGDTESDRLKSDLCCWLSLQGDNYEDQFEIILDFLEPKYEEYEKDGKTKQRLVSGFSDIRIIALDATGQGDFMPDKFERHTGYEIMRLKFTAELKDVMYKNLLQVIHTLLTEIPDVPDNEDYLRFREEMINLEKEYKGRFLSVHHPDDPKAHDDYADSWCIAEYAKSQYLHTEPTISII